MNSANKEQEKIKFEFIKKDTKLNPESFFKSICNKSSKMVEAKESQDRSNQNVEKNCKKEYYN